MNDTHARLLLSLQQKGDEERVIEEIVATHTAYMEAIERVLGASPASFSRIDAKAVSVWVRALREGEDV